MTSTLSTAMTTAPECSRDPNLFTGPKTILDLIQAQSVCDRCPYQVSCRSRGVELKESGVWGGALLSKGRSVRRFHRPESADD